VKWRWWWRSEAGQLHNAICLTTGVPVPNQGHAMDLLDLIPALSKPAAYPYTVDGVEVIQTHISVVFLAGEFVYKIKKPVQLGFLDFSTLEKRRHFCDEEVRLNRRLAPHFYLGVVPVGCTADGLQFEADGEVVEWAVKMQRLSSEATLQSRIDRDQVPPGTLKALARRIASFHAEATRGEHISSFGRFDVVAGNARENFAQASSQVGATLSQAVFDRLQALTEGTLNRLRPEIESRAKRNVPCDTHGDLHLDHVYVFPEKIPPCDLVIVDCIEFNERFRFADPIADMAFLVMDLAFHGRRELAQQFADEYFRALGDDAGRPLLPFYSSYRAAVRGKVEGMAVAEKEVSEAERAKLLTRARAHWLLALGELESADRRPALVLIAGLPGVGKSILAKSLAAKANFDLVRSDVVRKELAGTSEGTERSSGFESGIYSLEWTERTYAECLRRAEELLFEGKRVIVDANFRTESRRLPFLEAASKWAVLVAFLLCEASEETIRRRLQARQGDASDADWLIYQNAAQEWQEPGPITQKYLQRVSMEGSPDAAVAKGLEILRGLGIA
jgi:uncharacterized protein